MPRFPRSLAGHRWAQRRSSPSLSSACGSSTSSAGQRHYNIPWPCASRLPGRLRPPARLLRAGAPPRVPAHHLPRGQRHLRPAHPSRRPSCPCTLVDLSSLPESSREAEARRLAAEEAARPFNLARGPLLRTTLLRLDEQQHVLLMTMHHIVSDGWSMGVLVREMAALYLAFSSGQPSPLPELPLQYADYAVWQRYVVAGRGPAQPARLVEAAPVRSTAGPGAAHRLPAPLRPVLPGRRRPRPAPRAPVPLAARLLPEGGRHPLHGPAGHLPGAARPLLRPGGHRRR